MKKPIFAVIMVLTSIGSAVAASAIRLAVVFLLSSSLSLPAKAQTACLNCWNAFACNE